MSIKAIDFTSEFKFKTSKSSGKGGQHVNKVATKVTLIFNIPDSDLLTDAQKRRLLEQLANRVTQAKELHLMSDTSRTQLSNKKIVVDRFYELLEQALIQPKNRLPTKPSRSSKEKRLKEKKYLSGKKKLRGEDFLDTE